MTVILERDVSDTDQFGRLLRYVWLHSEANPMQWTLVNHELAAIGMADVKTYRPDVFWQGYLQLGEDDAKAAGLGIWAN